jgi:hypothetical protein
LNSLSEGTDEELERKLTFLLAQTNLPLTPAHEEFLCSLLKPLQMDSSKESSRNLAAQIILQSGNPRLWKQAIVGGGLEGNDISLFRKRWPTQERFLDYRTALAYPTLRSSVDLATVGHLLIASDRLGGDLEAYAEEVDSALRREYAQGSVPFHPTFQVPFSVQAMVELVRRHPQTVTGWIELATVDELDWAHVDFVKSTLPLYEALCEAMFVEQHPKAGDLYTILRDSTLQKRPVFQDRIGAHLPLLLFRVDVDDVRPFREDWYRACWRDVTLLDFATAARQFGRGDFLLELVQDGLCSPTYLEQARAICLAGWCGTGPQFRSTLDDLPVGEGSWFESLKKQALARADRERWARAWLSEFLTSRKLAQSFAAFRLFLRCVDRRYYAWRNEVIDSVPNTQVTAQRRLRFLNFNHRELERAIETNEKDLDKYFLGLRVPDGRLSPWTGLPPARGVSIDRTEC